MDTEQQAAWKLLIEQELRDNILPFWMNKSVDSVSGGFYGAITPEGVIDNSVERALVFCARMLWTYSAAYRLYQDPRYLTVARHAFDELRGRFLDPVYGGFYWSIDPQGQPLHRRKQIYGQAFAIYALAEMYLATGDLQPLALAQDTYRLIDQHARDRVYGGYMEGCAEDWSALHDMRLSAKELYNAPKSMNTLLHVLEAYTNLLRAWNDPALRADLLHLVDVFLERVIDPQTGLNRLFFDMDWSTVENSVSYGHDIEASWLLTEAAELLENPPQIARVQAAALRMADAVLRLGMDQDGSIFYEGSPKAITNDQKHWWVHAEGMVGFYNAYQLTAGIRQPQALIYLGAAQRLWEYIQAHFVDRRYGEWHKSLDRQGTPVGHIKAGPWEDPYHQSRACMEMIRRI